MKLGSGANEHIHAVPMGEEKSDARETIAASSLIDQKVAGDVDANCESGNNTSSKSKIVDRKIRVKITKRRSEQLEKTVETNNVKENNSTTTNEETIEANNSTGNNSSSDSVKGNGKALSESDHPDDDTASVEKPAFKISIVPLEKLLAQPTGTRTRRSNIENNKSIISTSTPSALPPRRSRNNKVSIIELSESEQEISDEELLVPLPVNVGSSSSSSSVKEQVGRKTRSNKQTNKTKSLLSKLLIDSDSAESSEPTTQTVLKSRRCVVRLKRTTLSTTSTETTGATTKELKNTTAKTKTTEGPEVEIAEKSKEEQISKTTQEVKKEKTSEEKSKAQAETETTQAQEEEQEQEQEKEEKTTSDSSTAEKATTTKTKDTVADKKVREKRKMSTDSSDMEKASTSKRNRRDKKVSDNDSDSDYKATAEDEQAEAESDEAKNSANEAEAQSEAEEEEAHSSGSEVMPQRKRRSFGGKKGAASANDSSDFEPEDKKTKKKRRRIKKNSSGDSDDGDEEKNKNKRKHIRKIIKTKDLDLTTKEAAKEEEDRRKRIEERQKLYNRIFEKSESVEITELVLDFDEESKKALLQVDKGLLKKLKPHQVDGVKFMWDACFETIKESQKGPGSGCILAHCMGLGKTLQVVTLSHTLLINSRRTGIERVLVISPLSTVNNWAREFVHWMGFAHRKDIEVYDISRFKDKPTRIFKLNEWFEEGGVCILGYDMYRILANEKAKGLRKKQREQLQQALVEPGPDLVVCDEGHLLKNEKTSISKAVTRMRSKRRIVLTGTPLQNNLKECK